MVRSEGNMSLKNSVTPPKIDPGTVRLVAQRLNHYATKGPKIIKHRILIKELSPFSSVPIQDVSKILRTISGVTATQQI
jgi:hypothetical protein